MRCQMCAARPFRYVEYSPVGKPLVVYRHRLGDENPNENRDKNGHDDAVEDGVDATAESG